MSKNLKEQPTDETLKKVEHELVELIVKIPAEVAIGVICATWTAIAISNNLQVSENGFDQVLLEIAHNFMMANPDVTPESAMNHAKTISFVATCMAPIFAAFSFGTGVIVAKSPVFPRG